MTQNAQTEATRNRLRQIFAHEERGLAPSVHRRLEDPLNPRKDDGTIRINPILVLLAGIAMLAAGTFLYFSIGGR